MNVLNTTQIIVLILAVIFIGIGLFLPKLLKNDVLFSRIYNMFSRSNKVNIKNNQLLDNQDNSKSNNSNKEKNHEIDSDSLNKNKKELENTLPEEFVLQRESIQLNLSQDQKMATRLADSALREAGITEISTVIPDLTITPKILKSRSIESQTSQDQTVIQKENISTQQNRPIRQTREERAISDSSLKYSNALSENLIKSEQSVDDKTIDHSTIIEKSLNQKPQEIASLETKITQKKLIIDIPQLQESNTSNPKEIRIPEQIVAIKQEIIANTEVMIPNIISIAEPQKVEAVNIDQGILSYSESKPHENNTISKKENLIPENNTKNQINTNDDDDGEIIDFLGGNSMTEKERAALLASVDLNLERARASQEKQRIAEKEKIQKEQEKQQKLIRTFTWTTFIGEDANTMGLEERRSLVSMLRDMQEPWCLQNLVNALREEEPNELRPFVLRAIVDVYTNQNLRKMYEYFLDDGNEEEKQIAQEGLDAIDDVELTK